MSVFGVVGGHGALGQKQMCCNRGSAFVRWLCSSFVFAKRWLVWSYGMLVGLCWQGSHVA